MTPARRLVHHADPIKGSRFRATVVPIEGAKAAERVVAEVKAADPDATHHCWAFRLGDGTTRCSDAGEPSGSAGKPILARLEGNHWIDTLVVVTRWFGGTKLGVGGLVRAYGRTAGEALRQVEPVLFVPTTCLRFRFGYSDQGVVTGILEGCGAMVTDTVYEADVVTAVRVPTERLEDLLSGLADATAGRVQTI